MVDEYTRYLEEKGRRKHRGLSRFKLKVIGDVLLFLSAASVTLMPMLLGAPTAQNMGSLTVSVLCEAVSWVAIPIYAWLLYTGFDHTHSWLRYGLQLLALALVSEVPYDMVTFGSFFDMRSQNPVFGLVIALIVLVLLEVLQDYGKGLRITLSIVVIIVGLLWDWLFRIGQSQAMLNIGMVTLGMALIFFYLHARENTMMFTAALLGAVCFITPGIGVAFLHYRNDEIGYRHTWTKWAFYAVYPLMMLVCGLVVVR